MFRPALLAAFAMAISVIPASAEDQDKEALALYRATLATEEFFSANLRTLEALAPKADELSKLIERTKLSDRFEDCKDAASALAQFGSDVAEMGMDLSWVLVMNYNYTLGDCEKALKLKVSERAFIHQVMRAAGKEHLWPLPERED